MRRLKTDLESWHVFARGARRLLLFYQDQDFAVFLNLLREALGASGCLLWAYCLMSNHFHLILRGTSEQVTECMRYLDWRYALYHNREHHLGGHVFEGPYKAYRQRSLFFLIRRIIYVFLNPVAAGMVGRPGDYRWSGFRSFMGLDGSPLPIDSQPVFDLLEPHVPGSREWFSQLLEERIKLLPPHAPPDPLSAVQVNAEQFEWLLEHAVARKDCLGGEDPRMVAIYWGSCCGIPPRAMAKVLGNVSPAGMRQLAWKYRQRIETHPTLLRLLTPP